MTVAEGAGSISVQPSRDTSQRTDGASSGAATESGMIDAVG